MGRVRGGGFPLPVGEGVWGGAQGAVHLPQKIFALFSLETAHFVDI